MHKPSIAFSNYRKVTGLAYDISCKNYQIQYSSCRTMNGLVCAVAWGKRVRGGSFRSAQKVSRCFIFIIFWSLSQNAFSTTIPERPRVRDGQSLSRRVGVLLELLLPSDYHPQVYIPIWRQHTHKTIYTVRRLRLLGVSTYRIFKHWP